MGPGSQRPHAQPQAHQINVPYASAYLRQKAMAFLANVEPPEVGCGCHPGPCPVLPVKVELEEMHKAGCLGKHEPEHPVLGYWSLQRGTKGDSGCFVRSKEIRHCPAVPVPNHAYHLRMESPLSEGWPLAREMVCRRVPDTWNMGSPQA